MWYCYNTMKDILKSCGFSDGESRVYTSLVDAGPSTLNSLHGRVGIERRNIYDILNKLIGKGLVAFMSENRHKVYSAVHPKKLLSILQERQQSIEDLKKEVSAGLNEMEARFNTAKFSISAEIFRGTQGIKTVWQDMLDYKEILWLGSGNYVPKKMPAFWSRWNTQRWNRKVQSYHLFRSEIRGSLIPNVGHARFLPPEFSQNPVVVTVYGDKVVNFLFGKELFAFVISSRELSQNFREYHKYLWEHVATP